MVERSTTPAQIQHWHDHQAGSLAYKTALRIATALKGDKKKQQASRFSMLKSYCERLTELDPRGRHTLRLSPTNRFENIFICPSSTIKAWSQLRPILAVDAGFTKTAHSYVLLLAAGIDANQEGILVAWGLAPGENFDHWSWFLENLDSALVGLAQRTTVIISDRQKGLTNAIAATLPDAVEAFCCKHIERNMEQRKYKTKAVDKFWKVIKAPTELAFKTALAEMRVEDPA